jgi:hypothetical protein
METLTRIIVAFLVGTFVQARATGSAYGVNHVTGAQGIRVTTIPTLPGTAPPAVTAADSGAANVYILAATASAGTLETGQTVQFVPAHANTGASTVTYNGGRAVAIVNQYGKPLTGGELSVATWLQYTGSVWQIVGTGPAPNRVRTPAEIAVNEMPVNFGYAPGDPRRWGAVGGISGTVPSTDDSAAWQSDVDTGSVDLPAGWAFKIVRGAKYTGQLHIIGHGQSSQIYSDGVVVTVTSGTNSTLSNFWAGNITAPWIITRDPANWSRNISSTLRQSNTVLGYQPTVNDVDIWSSLTAAQQNQNIGPVLYFSGAASGIDVNHIYGRFVRVEIRDAINSTIADCDVRGGKGVWATLAFDNWQDGIQRGSGNKLLRNTVAYGSFSGVMVGANDDFQMVNNVSYGNGESGTQTLQSFGIVFTGNVGGATNGNISSTPTPQKGAWTAVFQDGESRAVTVSGTSITWSEPLNAGSILSAYVYAGPAGSGAYQSTTAPHSTRGLICGNHVFWNYYDGIDAASTYPGTHDIIPTHHQICNNYSYNNGGDGGNSDGMYNLWSGNRFYRNNTQGIWNLASFSQFSNNLFQNNNIVNNASNADLGPGVQGNIFDGNTVYFGGGAGFPIYAPSTAGMAPHVARNNTVFNGKAFWGNPGQIRSLLSENVDASTHERTWQSFIITLANNGDTLQHAFYGDPGERNPGLFAKINSATNGGFTNTPTRGAFARGAEISTAVTNALVLDVGSQDQSMPDVAASVINDSTGTSIRVSTAFLPLTINGVAQYRLCLLFTNTGGAFALNTTNIPSGKGITIQVSGYLSSNLPAATDDHFHQR